MKFGSKIAEMANKSFEELNSDLKEIDARYDKKYESLDERSREIYKDYYNSLCTERSNIEKMIKDCKDSEERKFLLEKYFDNSLKFDGLYSTETKKVEKKDVELKEEKNKERGSRFKLFVAQVLVPAVIGGIAGGLASYGMNKLTNTPKTINTTNTPKLPKN